MIHREVYVLSNNSKTKFADWVAYRVTKNTIGRSKRLSWRADPDLLPEDTLEPEDYRGAHAKLGTDRGHQVPVADFSGTKHFKLLSYLSNSTPQKSQLNQRAWVHLEESIRRLANKKEVRGVYVMTGPLFEREMPELPAADEDHRIPSGYFKIVAILAKDEPVVGGFIFDQEYPAEASYCESRVRIAEIELRAQLDFFASLSPSRQRLIESKDGTIYERLGCREGR